MGADIPAGTYTLSAGKADDYYGYYVMKDLSYNKDSYLDQGYFMNVNEHPTVTLEEDTYIELYNLTTSRTKLQPVSSYRQRSLFASPGSFKESHF